MAGASFGLVYAWPIVIPAALVRRTSALSIRLLLGGGREEILRADADAVALTRDPEALAWALAHLTLSEMTDEDVPAMPGQFLRSRAAYYPVPPRRARLSDPYYDYPTFVSRVIRLRAMAGG